jgi:hypothetical protein
VLQYTTTDTLKSIALALNISNKKDPSPVRLIVDDSYLCSIIEEIWFC